MNFQHCKGKSNSLNVRIYSSNYLIPLCKTELFKWNFQYHFTFNSNQHWAGQLFLPMQNNVFLTCWFILINQKQKAQLRLCNSIYLVFTNSLHELKYITVQSLEKVFWQFTNRSTLEPTIPVLAILTQENWKDMWWILMNFDIHQKTCTRIFIAYLFIIIKYWKNLNVHGQRTDKYIVVCLSNGILPNMKKNMLWICTARWISVEKRSQTQKDIQCISSLTHIFTAKKI